jgi:SAM-dependent methyltransferase
MALPDDRVARWISALEARHLADLTFAEVTRALRSLSSAYVERRAALPRGRALDGKGKRAAFALFYGPLHFFTVAQIVGVLEPPVGAMGILDLGCGTGVAGAAWALASGRRPEVTGIDRHPWAVAEATRTYRELGIRGLARRGELDVPPRGADIVAAFTVNELEDDARERLRVRLLEARRRGSRILIVEPLAKSAIRWWPAWRDDFLAAGGRDDEWRFRADLPPVVQKLDRAAGLNHRDLTARSLWLS